jgi:hypothetical protein
MGAPQFSNWFAIPANGQIPAQYLPAGVMQYRWRIDTDIEIPFSWWGIGGGTMRMTHELQIGEAFRSTDELALVCVVLKDLFTAGLIAFWTYYPGTYRFSAQETVPTLLGFQGGWEYWGPTSDYGLTAGAVDGVLVSPIYEVEIPQGSTVEVKRYYPCSNLPRGYQVQMRTAPGGRVKTPMLIDPVTHEQHLPRVIEGCLLWRSPKGIVSGLGVKLADGVATVAPGVCWIEFTRRELRQAATVAAGTGGTRQVSLVWADGVLAPVVHEQPLGDQPHCCLAQIVGTRVTGLGGTLVATGVTDFAVGRREDGRLVVRVDTREEQDRIYWSRDRGVTWEQQA